MDWLEDTFGSSGRGVIAARRGPVGEVFPGGDVRVGGSARRRPSTSILEDALVVSRPARVAERELGYIRSRVSDMGFCFFQVESSGARNSAVYFPQSW